LHHSWITDGNHSNFFGGVLDPSTMASVHRWAWIHMQQYRSNREATKRLTECPGMTFFADDSRVSEMIGLL
jgi:hypothetical protein